MKMPDITPAQIVAAVGSAGAEAVAYKLLSPGAEQLVVSIAGIVVPGVLMVGDAVIRHGRSKIAVAELEAEAGKVLALLAHHGKAHEITGVTPAATTETAAAAIAQAKT